MNKRERDFMAGFETCFSIVLGFISAIMWLFEVSDLIIGVVAVAALIIAFIAYGTWQQGTKLNRFERRRLDEFYR